VEFQHDDVRFSDSFAEYFIERLSQPGDLVFDPFAGFGTTLLAAEKLKRRALGIEFLPERVAYIKSIVKNPNGIVCGSALKLDELNVPDIDFILTSPPYMQKTNHPEYPFAGYQITGQGYADYLRDISSVFAYLRKNLKSGAYVVIEVSNLLINDAFTPLAWDIVQSVGAALSFKQELIIHWQCNSSPAYGFGYDHSYALVFQNGG
jgi:DNA modification methylase